MRARTAPLSSRHSPAARVGNRVETRAVEVVIHTSSSSNLPTNVANALSAKVSLPWPARALPELPDTRT